MHSNFNWWWKSNNDRIKHMMQENLSGRIHVKALESIIFRDIEIKTLKVSCKSDPPWPTGDMSHIGVMFLKCPADAKTRHNSRILPGYIHLKKVSELENSRGELKDATLHELCLKDITEIRVDKGQFLICGFSCSGIRVRGSSLSGWGVRDPLEIKSATFNIGLYNYFYYGTANPDKDCKSDPKVAEIRSKLNDLCPVTIDREAVEFFTPILQTVMRKFKIEKKIGFTVDVEYLPLLVWEPHAEIYAEYRHSPDDSMGESNQATNSDGAGASATALSEKVLQWKIKYLTFPNKEEFYGWCRKYYESDYNTNSDFEYWFLGDHGTAWTLHDTDLDHFVNFAIEYPANHPTDE